MMKVWMDKDSYYPVFYEKKEPVYGRDVLELEPWVIGKYRETLEQLDLLTPIIAAAWKKAQEGAG